MDDDLHVLNTEQLIAEVKKCRDAIRGHRDSSGHDLCWYHPQLWSVLPEERTSQPRVPEWPQFMRGCIKYRQSLDLQLPDSERYSAEFEKDE